MANPHEHRPTYANWHVRRQNKYCAICRRPVRCVNLHLDWLAVLPLFLWILFFLATGSNPITDEKDFWKMIVTIGIICLTNLLQRLIFPHLQFEIDEEAELSDTLRNHRL